VICSSSLATTRPRTRFSNDDVNELFVTNIRHPSDAGAPQAWPPALGRDSAEALLAGIIMVRFYLGSIEQESGTGLCLSAQQTLTITQDGVIMSYAVPP
jgi:hypothetical protein